MSRLLNGGALVVCLDSNKSLTDPAAQGHNYVSGNMNAWTKNKTLLIRFFQCNCDSVNYIVTLIRTTVFLANNDNNNNNINDNDDDDDNDNNKQTVVYTRGEDDKSKYILLLKQNMFYTMLNPCLASKRSICL